MNTEAVTKVQFIEGENPLEQSKTLSEIYFTFLL